MLECIVDQAITLSRIGISPLWVSLIVLHRNTERVLGIQEKKRYQALVGSVLYLMHATRPDLAYGVIRLSQYAARPRLSHWEGLLRILHYLKRTMKAVLTLESTSTHPSGHTEQLIGYFDAAHADRPDRRSTCGYLFLWNRSLISWCSKVQRTVALSATEAEYMSGTEATKEALWIKSLLTQLCNTPIQCTLRGDNQGTIAFATNPVYLPSTGQTYRLPAEIH